MIIEQWNYLGPRTTPHEVRALRKSSFDHHLKLGQPVVHKHRWNARDAREGKTRPCPFHDVTLDTSSALCPYCFGTGFLGGYSDGVITYVSIGDTTQDTLRIGREGQLFFETHPQFTAPWVPEMGDGDIIITAEFNPITWEVVEEGVRYTLQEVTPKSMRGFSATSSGYRVQQQGSIDKLPYEDFLYTVPVVFDYSNVPPDPVIPPGGDPNDYPAEGAQVSSFSVGIRIIASQTGTREEIAYPVVVHGLGDTSSRSQSVNVAGKGGGAIVVFNEE